MGLVGDTHVRVNLFNDGENDVSQSEKGRGGNSKRETDGPILGQIYDGDLKFQAVNLESGLPSSTK